MPAAMCSLIALAVLAKTPKNQFVFRVPEPVRPETVQVRYSVTGKSGDCFGWQSYEDEAAIWIPTDCRESRASALKAVVFLPGCEPERVVAGDLRTSSREHALQCRAAQTTTLRGKFTRPAEWQSLRVQVNIDYVAPWVNQFLGAPNSDVATVGAAIVSADATGRFDATLPVGGDAQGGPDGAFALVLREATSGNILGVLHPPQELIARYGLKTAAQYPSIVEFTLERNR